MMGREIQVRELLAQGSVGEAEKMLDQIEREKRKEGGVSGLNEMWKAVLEGYAKAGAVGDGKLVYFKVDWESDQDRMWSVSKMMSACVASGDMAAVEVWVLCASTILSKGGECGVLYMGIMMEVLEEYTHTKDRPGVVRVLDQILSRDPSAWGRRQIKRGAGLLTYSLPPRHVLV